MKREDVSSSRAKDQPGGQVAPGGEFQALLARVEAATGPDRELDAAICAALAYGGGKLAGLAEGWSRHLTATPPDSLWGKPGRVYVMVRHVTEGLNPHPHGSWEAAPLTASLDAALTLTDKALSGWATSDHTPDGAPETYPIRKHILIYDDGSCEVTLSYCHPKIEPRDIGSGYHWSGAPLAVCAALLKAISAQSASPAAANDQAREEPFTAALSEPQ